MFGISPAVKVDRGDIYIFTINPFAIDPHDRAQVFPSKQEISDFDQKIHQ